MALTRRRFITVASVTGLTTVFAGCSGGDGGDGGNGGTPTDTPTDDAGDGATPTDGMDTPTPTADAGDGTTTTTGADGGATVTVDMTGSQFDPRNLEIDVGATVRWVNQDTYAHTITAASDNWSVDVEVAGGGSATHTFEAAGVYDVYCRFHGGADLSGMSMKIAVGDATIEQPLGGGGGGATTAAEPGTTTTESGGGGGGGLY